MRTVRVRVAAADGDFNEVDRILRESDQFERDMVLEMEWFSDGSAIILYRIRGGRREDLQALLSSTDGVAHADVLDDGRAGSHTAYVEIEPEPPMSDMIAMADDHGLLINNPIVFSDDAVELYIAGPEAELRSSMTGLPEDVEFTIEHASDGPPTERSLQSQLTDRQREAVRAAIDLGYYETPREATYEDIAEYLDCAPSTANELLRRAETTLITAVFGG